MPLRAAALGFAAGGVAGLALSTANKRMQMSSDERRHIESQGKPTEGGEYITSAKEGAQLVAALAPPLCAVHCAVVAAAPLIGVALPALQANQVNQASGGCCPPQAAKCAATVAPWWFRYSAAMLGMMSYQMYTDHGDPALASGPLLGLCCQVAFWSGAQFKWPIQLVGTAAILGASYKNHQLRPDKQRDCCCCEH